MTNQIQGNAGVSGAVITYSGTASGSVTADNLGQFAIQHLAAGSYTITPSLTGYTFTPTNASETIVASDIYGVNFTAASVSTAWSEVDSRVAPNSTLDVQDTQQYVVTSTPSHAQPVDSD